jgi:hypothetical protein
VCASSQAGFTDLAPSEVVNTMPSILFVCTGNILRSLIAEYALKARLDPHSPIRGARRSRRNTVKDEVGVVLR